MKMKNKNFDELNNKIENSLLQKIKNIIEQCLEINPILRPSAKQIAKKLQDICKNDKKN